MGNILEPRLLTISLPNTRLVASSDARANVLLIYESEPDLDSGLRVLVGLPGCAVRGAVDTHLCDVKRLTRIREKCKASRPSLDL